MRNERLDRRCTRKMRHFCPRTLLARSIVSMMSAASCLPSVVLFACGARAHPGSSVHAVSTNWGLEVGDIPSWLMVAYVVS
jgi:hypothetical protein